MFWKFQRTNEYAVITNTYSYTYEELDDLIIQQEKKYTSNQKELILLFGHSSIDTVAIYLAALRQRHTVMLVDGDLEEMLALSIIETYQPKWIVGRSIDALGYVENVRQSYSYMTIYDETALLLSTSGTTGSRKFVRLSYDNLQSNAKSIATYMQLTHQDRGILNLPLSYSYGLSILNSHLFSKGTLLLTEDSVMTKSFWTFIQEHRGTVLSGVPFTYQMLRRLGFLKKNYPSLRLLTQAGGHLDEAIVRQFLDYAQKYDKQFLVMYGQTEASPRISYVPSERLEEKVGTIGIPIPGGNLTIEDEELVYRGPNVMLGYAETLEDLEKPNELEGVLHTGDLAVEDKDGYFKIIGRKSRFVKLHGLRISLDEVEKKVQEQLQVEVAAFGEDDRLNIAYTEGDEQSIRNILQKSYQLHHSVYKIRKLDHLPRNTNGKIHYQRLKELR